MRELALLTELFHSFTPPPWALVRDTQHPLTSRLRLTIYRAILAQPGIPLQTLAAKLDLPMGTLRFHVDLLERGGIVHTRIAGRRRIAFAEFPESTEIPEDRAFLQEPTSRRIVLEIVAHPNVSLTDIQESTGLSQRAVYYHAKRLLDAGLIVAARDGTYAGLRPTARLYTLLGHE